VLLKILSKVAVVRKMTKFRMRQARGWQKLASPMMAIGSIILWSIPVQSQEAHPGINPGVNPGTPPGTAAIWPPILQAQADQGDIVDVAMAEGSFQILIGLLNELGMTEDLRGYGRFTVFAPTDAAFQALPEPVLNRLQNDRELAARILAYHVVASGATPLSSRDLRSQNSLTTLERSSLQIRRRRGTLYVNDARVTESDIAASNGVIHAIDQVLIPPEVMNEL
jgi:uncharacterized surface protein with fasciclin (FAS1) repeats